MNVQWGATVNVLPLIGKSLYNHNVFLYTVDLMSS